MRTESFRRAEPGEFHFLPEPGKILDERWSDISPGEGTEECVCSWCGKMIGRDEWDPAREDHIDYCTGCEICELAVRMWKDDPEHPGKKLELRFHGKCYIHVTVGDGNPARGGADH
jgi:hypothetical protein